jgi:uncharacterized protein
MVRAFTALAAFALFLLPSMFSQGIAQSRQKPAKPAMWVVKDVDTTIYLFGTIHAVPKGAQWRTAKFNAAMAASDELVVEVADLDDTAKIQPIYARLAATPGLLPILDRVSPTKRDAVQKIATMTKTDLAQLRPFESWAVANILSYELLKSVGISTENGIDRQIVAEFRASKRPVSGIETVEEQLGAFDGLSNTSQIYLLEGITDELENAAQEFDTLWKSWSHGDVNAIDSESDKELKGQPELLDKLLVGRNRNWTERLVARMKKPGTVFLAVGSGHLVGKDAVQAMLKARGIKARRVQ